MMERTLEPTEALCDDDAKVYDSLSQKHWFWVDRPFVRKAARLAQGRSVALDIGCGPGHVAVALAKRCPHLTVYALDPSDTMLEIVLQNARQAGVADRVKPVQGDACDLPFKDHSLDLVLSLHAWHHLPDPRPALREIHRVLAPQGGCMIRDLRRPRSKKATDRLVARYGTLLGYTPDERLQYFHSLRAALTLEELQQWTQEAGLTRAQLSRQPAQHLDLIVNPKPSLRISGQKLATKRALRWVPPLAAAASLLIMAGAAFWRAEPELAATSSTRGWEWDPSSHAIVYNASDESGVRETSIESGAGEFGRFNHEDGSLMAVAERSRVRWREHNNVKQLEMLEGTAYLDAMPQETPIRISYPSGIMKGEILGTRVLSARTPDGQEHFSLLSGRARVLLGDFDTPVDALIRSQPRQELFSSFPAPRIALMLSPGQSVTTLRPGRGRPLPMFALYQQPPENLGTDWLTQAGIPAAAPPSTEPMKPLSQLDLGLASPSMGSWQIERQGHDLRARYTHTDTHGGIAFGAPQWESGTFSASFHLPAIPAPVNIGATFLTPHGEFISASTTINPEHPSGEYRIRVQFEVDRPNNTLVLRHFETRSAKNPNLSRVMSDWTMIRANPTLNFDSVAPGVYIKGIDAEISNLRLEKATKATGSQAL